MIERVEIENFRCLRDVEFELEPLTVFVGPNASGKSAILEAMDTMRFFNPDLSDVWRHGNSDMSARYVHNTGTEVSVERKHISGEWRFAHQMLRLDLDALRSTNRPREVYELNTSGSNLTNLFETLTRSEQAEFVEEFCDLVPVYDDINTKPVQGELELRFSDRWDDVEYEPDEVSDGTMFMLAFLMLKYQPERPDVVTVEEPERGLHPYLLEQLVKLLRYIAADDEDDDMQFMLATHSAQLLEYLEPEELRFVDRDPETGATSVQVPPVEKEAWSNVMERYLDSLGSAWLAGELGGVPGRKL